MITLWLFTILTTTVHAQACRNRVDPNKVVLFVDANTGERELVAARRAACARGETVLAIPQDVPEAEGEVSTDAIDTVLSRLDARGARAVSLIVSGHDGGGNYGSAKGDISRQDILETFDEYPQQRESIRSLYLLGCYTTVRSEVFAWNEGLPNVRMIAGYEERAPLSDRPAGHTYLEGMMAREERALQTSTPADLAQLLTQVQNINMLQAAVWVQTSQCNAETGDYDAFYFRPNPLFGTRTRIQSASAADCRDAVARAPSYKTRLAAYYDGVHPIPANTVSGDLREIYNFLQGSGHCFPTEMAMPPWDQAFALMFWEDFKMSSARWLENQTTRLAQDIAALTVDSVKAGLDERIAEEAEQERKLQAQLAAFTADPAAAIAQMRKEKAEIDASIKRFMQSPGGIRMQEAMVLGRPIPPELREGYKTWVAQYYRADTLNSEIESAELSSLLFKGSLEDSAAIYRERQSHLSRMKAGVTEEMVAGLRALPWLPTPANMAQAGRAQVNEGVYGLNRYAGQELLPPRLRDSVAALASSSQTLLVAGQCLPMAWHEDTGRRPTRGPSCDPTIVIQ